MKKTFQIFLTSIFLLASVSVLAYKSYNNSYARPQGSYGSGSTHYVQSYTKQDGTYVEGHLAGNPNSGVHCHDNVCE